MALGVYTEPHGASPGSPYALREQVPHADLNQVVTNQRNLWNQVRGSGAIEAIVFDLKQYVSFNIGSVASTTYTTVYTNDGGVTDPLSLAFPGTQQTGDVFEINVGPFEVLVGSTGTPAPSIQVRVHVLQGTTHTYYMREIKQGIPTVSSTFPLDFTIFYTSLSSGTITISVEARLKVSSTVACLLNTPGVVDSDQSYGPTATPQLHQWIGLKLFRNGPL